MRASLLLVLTLLIEIIFLLVVVLVLIVGVLGIFLPILPGIVLIGAAVGLYTLILKNEKARLTPHVHRRLLRVHGKIINLKITNTIMGIIKAIKKKKEERVREEILKHGLVLFGFNVALVLGFIFGFLGLTIVGSWVDPSGYLILLFPVAAIFIFAGLSAIVWYRFGQILGLRFKNRKVVNASLVVLISLLPLLAILLMMTAILGTAGGFGYNFIAVTFLGLLVMCVLSAAFELLVVSLGVVTRRE